MKYQNPFKGFTRFEMLLWLSSCFLITVLFALSPERDVVSSIASLIGVTALIFVARGNVLGQVLTIVFSLFYAVISYRFQYYGEMITYLGMSAPIALFSAISWFKNPFDKEKNEVKIAVLNKKKFAFLSCLTLLVTFIFYFILRYFETANLFMSTVSIATSFMASSLMFLRSPYYAIAYGCNDIVLIILWVMATLENAMYLPMVLCFVIFLVNDIYGFINWERMKTIQSGKIENAKAS